MSVKRLRIFAGPNGSGKSTFIAEFESRAKNYKLYTYINADDLKNELFKTGSIDLSFLNLKIDIVQIQTHFKNSTFSPEKLNYPNLWAKLAIKENRLYVADSKLVDSYFTADLADFLRFELIKHGKSFSFETVMSDAKKLEFLSLAKQKDYKIYLYYFATSDPKINVRRVNIRVQQNGHHVPEETIIKRYTKSLNHLKQAIKLSHDAYVFDTSQNVSHMIANIKEGRKLQLMDLTNVPEWFSAHVLEK